MYLLDTHFVNSATFLIILKLHGWCSIEKMTTFVPLLVYRDMYESQGINDIYFLMLYGGAATFALVAGLYLLFRRSNAIEPSINSSKNLRQWAAAFMFSLVASHLWWPVVGVSGPDEDRLVRVIIVEALDYITFFPLLVVVLVNMLQDRQRKLWPIGAFLTPVALIAIIGIIYRFKWTELTLGLYTLFAGIVFVIYMVRAVRDYGRWLHDNYADIEHKEVWQSFVLLAVILIIYLMYALNTGWLVLEYLTQIDTFFIIGFIVWRVETLQHLDSSEEEEESDETNGSLEEETNCDDNETCEAKDNASASTTIPSNIGALLEKHCEETKVYLLHDLSLTQLATHIGTNRTYLSAYFAQQGITYNAYINRLRIEHFINIYRKNVSSHQQSLTAQQLAEVSGYKSYSTFSVAFKKIMGENVTTWMKTESGS